jgi:HK97 family phage prohead protease
LMLQHGMGPLTQDQLPIGLYTAMAEDSHGLHVRGKLALGMQVANDVYTLMKMQPRPALNGLSIGYRVTKATKHPAGQMLDGRIRTLHAVHLGEVSLVTDPSCDPARVSSVKSADAGDRVMQGLRKLQAMLST